MKERRECKEVKERVKERSEEGEGSSGEVEGGRGIDEVCISALFEH